MLSSFLMTFFCYNTATTIAMVPIGLSLLQELEAVCYTPWIFSCLNESSSFV